MHAKHVIPLAWLFSPTLGYATITNEETIKNKQLIWPRCVCTRMVWRVQHSESSATRVSYKKCNSYSHESRVTRHFKGTSYIIYTSPRTCARGCNDSSLATHDCRSVASAQTCVYSRLLDAQKKSKTKTRQ
ncbi:hypothetical protein IE81DRAFT_106493 [Ceraceosorus guamensis]|uniref:Secreted protein n=1 Tax=Ceraceosorus guamensis TaxID=1522189 RepID=A0A316VZI0_9BASI|nr:hypothetical protein IE81DRAFT_106493 [Ceraceosorus guamensis]PWN42940.1 hypothetical protein IE81DRAFT_106493 [Ceraceosorus guamensis]